MFRPLLVSAFLAIAALLGAYANENNGEIILREFPHHLSLEYKEKPICGASLIKPKVALTAAHCTHKKDEYLLRVRGGAISENCGAGVVAQVVNVCNPNNYDHVNRDFDISVLTLSRALLFPPLINQVNLQPSGTNITAGTTGKVTGWRFSDSTGHASGNLEAISMTKISRDTCADILPTKTVSGRMTCYIEQKGRKCDGQEFGGALIIGGVQEGIASWGASGLCGTSSNPTVYTRISHPEIALHIEECQNAFSP